MNFCIYDIETNILFEQNDIIVKDYCTEFDSVIEDEIDQYVAAPVAAYATTYAAAKTPTYTGKACPPDYKEPGEGREKVYLGYQYGYGYID